MNLPASVLTKNQCTTKTKDYVENGRTCRIVVHIQYDDQHEDGYNTFSITGVIYEKYNGVFIKMKGGGIQKDIKIHFPELQKYIPFDSCSSNGPMNYVESTIYFAGDRDCFEKSKGQPLQWEKRAYFGDFPIAINIKEKFLEYCKNLSPIQIAGIEIISIDQEKIPIVSPEWTFEGYTESWQDCPFSTKREAEEFLTALKEYPLNVKSIPISFSKGKERELDRARISAIWPEATDEELSVSKEELEQKLIDRLPALMETFKIYMIELGFTY